MSEEERLQSKDAALGPVRDERQGRLWAAAEARAWGRGGVTWVARATGITRKRIPQGLREWQEWAGTTLPSSKSRKVWGRRPGGGRRRLTERDPERVRALEALVEPTTRGAPMSPLRWTCKSTAHLAAALTRAGPRVRARTVAALLKELDYRLQGLRKTKEGTAHPDRNAPFEHIAAQGEAFQERGQPVVSGDTKKKEWGGAFKNGGQEWPPQGEPEAVRVHDFVDRERGKVNPYGVYDQTLNTGGVRVGTDPDPAAFAVQSLRTWGRQMGQASDPEGTELLVTAAGGGSNGSRCRLWKTELQRCADETGRAVRVCPFPPGTSKGNKSEHRRFCHLTQNGRGRPLVSHEASVPLSGSTTTRTGLTIRAGLDTGRYPTGLKGADDELAAVQLTRTEFHGDWNYSITPRCSATIG